MFYGLENFLSANCIEISCSKTQSGSPLTLLFSPLFGFHVIIFKITTGNCSGPSHRVTPYQWKDEKIYKLIDIIVPLIISMGVLLMALVCIYIYLYLYDQIQNIKIDLDLSLRTEQVVVSPGHVIIEHLFGQNQFLAERRGSAESSKLPDVDVPVYQFHLKDRLPHQIQTLSLVKFSLLKSFTYFVPVRRIN